MIKALQGDSKGYRQTETMGWGYHPESEKDRMWGCASHCFQVRAYILQPIGSERGNSEARHDNHCCQIALHINECVACSALTEP